MASTESEEKNKLYSLFEDSEHAEKYSKYRPRYPIELKHRVLSYMEENGFSDSASTSLMLDIGCGTGIGTRLFAPSFSAVWGVDISREQIKQAVINSQNNDFYLMSLAETTNFKDNTFDLITVGQAWHWFNHEKFNTEVSRILAPNGFLVVFGYGRPVISHFDATNEILRKHHYETLGPFWSDRRKFVDNHYRYIDLPFTTRHRIEDLEIHMEVSLCGFMDYQSTLSSVQTMNKTFPGNSVLEELRRDLTLAIGGSDAKEDFNPILDVRAPIFIEIVKKTE